MSLLDEIKKLSEKLTQYEKDLDDIARSLENKSVALEQKEKELGNIKDGLWACQSEKDNITEQLGEKIEELKNSGLSQEEKSKQIFSLVGDGFSRLSGCSQSLNKLWNDYASSRDKVIEILRERDKHAYKAIDAINDTKKNQWIIIWVLLGVIIALSLSLSLLLLSAKKKTVGNSLGLLLIIDALTLLIRLLDIKLSFKEKEPERKFSLTPFFSQNPPKTPCKSRLPPCLFFKWGQ